MTNLKGLVGYLLEMPRETAAENFISEDYTARDSRDIEIEFYSAALRRANRFMDRDANRITGDVLNIQSRGEAERAIVAYDIAYLMQLGLSLEATSELAKSLIALVIPYKVVPPDAWRAVANYNVELEEQIQNRPYPRKLLDL